MNYTFDKTFSIILLAVSILFIFQATQISDSAYGSTVGPKIFPLGLGIILGLLSLQLFYESWKNAVRERITGGPTAPSKTSSTELKKFLIIFGSAIAYVFFLEKIGYVITTFLFLCISFQTMERAKLIYSIIIATGFSLGVYYLFTSLLGGSLPSFPTF
ncbi:tripartite tricarboxylate transporter TctB family protein [Lysinibacillus fusiformis]|uniref:tripartite tricarboxylate transporter TctB family protein n=1 Tax=Lysinibacillus fusiformis TaxID=28031 RepID=UPI0020C03FAF|nr:tripartite tricarboxylate transporter TctB family protein [Lysinibacillus fusiformis]WRS99478.1 tripartite tricarboxylate transporter TctB family protein [Lysinibacillus fusiformis]